MVSRFLRRSGIAMGLVADVLDWVADTVYQVGVGLNCEESAVFREAWPKAKIVGFEANPNTVKHIQHRYPGKLHAVAVGDHTGRITLNVKRRHADGASVLDFKEGIITKPVDVPISTLDLLVPGGPPTTKTLLWLDCEGFELQALYGAADFLRKVEVINVEMTARPYGPEWSTHKEVHQHLHDLGFMRQWMHTHRISSGQVDVIYVRPELFKPQYCCCPCELQDKCE